MFLKYNDFERGCMISKIKKKLKNLIKKVFKTDSVRLNKNELLLAKTKTPFPRPLKGEKARVYYIEILSNCDLKCGLCAHGNSEIFQRANGIMSLEKFEKILDKIKKESPSAVISPYHHCEPSLHPQLPEYVKAIKDRGFYCACSFNFNHLNRLEDLLKSGVDSIEISVSGFYQETYEKSHIKGNIETVKNNMKILKEAIDKLDSKVAVKLIYHMYKDNLDDDYDKMKEFTDNLGFTFAPAWARSISLELTLKYLRENNLNHYNGETLQWFDDIKPLSKGFKSSMERIIYLPEDYQQDEWAKIQAKGCPVDRSVINIRWTGEWNLCGCAFDDRFMAGDFLTTPAEKIYKLRTKHPVCKECLANNFVFYSQYSGMDEIDKKAHKRLDSKVLANRKFGG